MARTSSRVLSSSTFTAPPWSPLRARGFGVAAQRAGLVDEGLHRRRHRASGVLAVGQQHGDQHAVGVVAVDLVVVLLAPLAKFSAAHQGVAAAHRLDRHAGAEVGRSSTGRASS
jgi:hypothetical protein